MRLLSFTLPSAWSRLLLTGCVALALAGCGRKHEKVELPTPPAPLSVTAESIVSGELSKFLDVVPGTYQVSVAKDDENYKTTVKVKVRLVSPTTIKAGRGYNDFGPVLTASLGDANGAPLDDFDNMYANVSYGDLASLLKQGKGEQWLIFATSSSFSGYNEETNAAALAKANKFLAALNGAKKISLTSKIEEERFEEKDNASTSTAGSVASDTDADTDCDAFLEGYEEYVNDYVALAKEMQENPSDATLLAKSSALSMKAAGWAGKIQGCQNDAAFQAKYMALSARMAGGM